MPLDRRLREGIGRITSEVDPGLDRNLDRTVRRARRTIAFRRGMGAVALVASILVAIVVGPRALDALRHEHEHRPAANPTNTSPLVIAGTYETVIANDRPVVRQNRLAGHWTIQLDANGTMIVSAPDSFTGVLSGILYRIEGDRFRTNLFVQDICSGQPVTYLWARSGGELRFMPLGDSCMGRVAVLATAPWTRVG
jgi:hypothetical protein